LVGYSKGGRIKNSHSSGKIKIIRQSENINAGGLVGKAENTEIKDSSSSVVIETTGLKVWSIGSFFVLILGVIILIVYTIKTNLPWWQCILMIVSGQSLLLIIGVFILRYTGKLSETSFIHLISLALNKQFNIRDIVKLILKR